MDKDSIRSNGLKLFYRPIEAAIRWCGLFHIELLIIKEFDESSLPTALFCKHPCLKDKLDLMSDAIRHHELPYGCFGINVDQGTQVEPRFLTVRHNDLRKWLDQLYPHEKPDFLFFIPDNSSALELTTNKLNYLLAEIQLCKIEQERLHDQLMESQKSISFLLKKNSNLSAKLRHSAKPSERSERNYLRLIGALINLMLGKSPGSKPYSSFTSQASIISALMAHNRNKPGFSQRNLEDKFSAANRSIDDE